MSEKLIEKLDRMGQEAGIHAMTPELRKFALLVRNDLLAQWSDEERKKFDALARQLIDANKLASDPTPLIISAFKHRLAEAIEQMPFGDTAASFATFVREFK